MGTPHMVVLSIPSSLKTWPEPVLPHLQVRLDHHNLLAISVFQVPTGFTIAHTISPTQGCPYHFFLLKKHGAPYFLLHLVQTLLLCFLEYSQWDCTLLVTVIFTPASGPTITPGLPIHKRYMLAPTFTSGMSLPLASKWPNPILPDQLKYSFSKLTILFSFKMG